VSNKERSTLLFSIYARTLLPLRMDQDVTRNCKIHYLPVAWKKPIIRKSSFSSTLLFLTTNIHIYRGVFNPAHHGDKSPSVSFCILALLTVNKI